MKIGDLVKYQWGSAHDPEYPDLIGTVLDFLPATHAKQFQKIKVLTQDGQMQDWIMQFCEVVNESR